MDNFNKTQYGSMPRKKNDRPDTLYLKKQDNSEIIEFRNELTYWTNRIEEIKTHYGSTLHPSQIQELLELQTKINHVKESILPGRKCFNRSDSNLGSPMLSPIISPIISPNCTPLSSQPTSPRHSQSTTPGQSPRNTMIFRPSKPLPIPPGKKPPPPSGSPPMRNSQELISSEPSPIPSPRRSAPKRIPSDQSIYKNRIREDEVSLPSRRRSGRSRSGRNSWHREKSEDSEENKPSSAPKSFSNSRRRYLKSKTPTSENIDTSELQLGLALIKAVKYLDTN